MVRKKTPLKPRPQIKKKGSCYFCINGKTPDYKDYQTLTNFISDRAKMVASVYTGVCSHHQRELGISVKRARYLGLLPYLPRA